MGLPGPTPSHPHPLNPLPRGRGGICETGRGIAIPPRNCSKKCVSGAHAFSSTKPRSIWRVRAGGRPPGAVRLPAAEKIVFEYGGPDGGNGGRGGRYRVPRGRRRAQYPDRFSRYTQPLQGAAWRARHGQGTAPAHRPSRWSSRCRSAHRSFPKTRTRCSADFTEVGQRAVFLEGGMGWARQRVLQKTSTKLSRPAPAPAGDAGVRSSGCGCGSSCLPMRGWWACRMRANRPSSTR